MTKIIVELCQNHLGNPELLRQMVRAAAEAGADYVKMQSIFSEDVTFRERFEEGSTDPDGVVRVIKRPYQAEYDRLSKLDLSFEDHLAFIKECELSGVIPMTTVFSRQRVAEVGKLPWPERVIKVASYDCGSFPMLKELAAHFDHFIVSTGASYDEEIAGAATLLKNLGKKVSLLHCVTSYPNTLGMANLVRMDWLRQFTDEVGWSDHTLVERDGLVAAKAAIASGADYVERHFTVLGPKDTKDGPVSITPEMLSELARFRSLPVSAQYEELRMVYPDWHEVLLGTPTRDMTHTELLNRDYYRGRFASRSENGGWLYNWEHGSLATPRP